MRRLFIEYAMVVMLASGCFRAWTQAPATPGGLTWDATTKEVRVEQGKETFSLSFFCTNTTSAEIEILNTQTSCGCTVANLPSQPYFIPAGGSGKIDVTMDIRGKYGMVAKTITVNTKTTPHYLTIVARIPDPIVNATPAAQMTQQQRENNQKISKLDRQAALRGDCARCHVTPGEGKAGKDLFVSICGVCHEAQHRASMVPDLKNPMRPAQRDYWFNWIMFGKEGTLMPAFSKSNGGVLTDEQIFSLVEYMVGPFQEKKAATNTPAPPAPH